MKMKTERPSNAYDMPQPPENEDVYEYETCSSFWVFISVVAATLLIGVILIESCILK